MEQRRDKESSSNFVHRKLLLSPCLVLFYNAQDFPVKGLVPYSLFCTRLQSGSSPEDAPTENGACNFKVLSKSGEETLVENGRAPGHGIMSSSDESGYSRVLSLSLSRENETTSSTGAPSHFRIIFHPPNTRLIGCFVTRFRDRLIIRLLLFLSSRKFSPRIYSNYTMLEVVEHFLSKSSYLVSRESKQLIPRSRNFE